MLIALLVVYVVVGALLAYSVILADRKERGFASIVFFLWPLMMGGALLVGALIIGFSMPGYVVQFIRDKLHSEDN